MADYTIRKISDAQYSAASKLLANPADGTHTVIKVPKNTWVKNVTVIITTAGAADATATVGFLGNGETADADAFLVSTVFDPDALGSRSSLMGAALFAAGKHFTRAGAITVTTANGTGDSPTFQVFADYVRLNK